MSGSAQVIDFPKPSKRRGAGEARPEQFIELPRDNKDLVRRALEIIEICRSDAGQRAAYYRQLHLITETGKSDGGRSLINLLYTVIDRLSSFLFSPSEVRFTMDFENEYPAEILRRGQRVARLVGTSFERTNTDLMIA